MILVTFALPDESRDFVVRLTRRSQPVSGRLPAIQGELGGRRVLVVHTGVGDSSGTRLALETALNLSQRAAPIRALIVAGFAGALRPGVAVGDLVLGENFSDRAWVETARAVLAGEPLHVGVTCTEPTAAETVAAKSALHAGTGAIAVDMETAWVLAAVKAKVGAPTLSLRVISDAADQDFPVPGGVMFDAASQRPRYLALPAYLMSHPARIRPFVRFVRGLGPARGRLAAAIEKVIATLATG